MARIALSRPNRPVAADTDSNDSIFSTPFSTPWILDEQALAETLGLAQLMPEAHAAYRPLLVDGLRFFLERLPPLRQARILAEQLRLPEDSSPARRLVTLLRQCPTLHKMGQVVARDQRLAPELRLHLQELESLAPTAPMEEIGAAIQREWGTIPGLEVAPTALAEGSVAVIVPAIWRESTTSTPQQGVFKVLRPGIEKQLHEELAIWSELGAFLEVRCVELGLPLLDYRHTLDSVRHLLIHEIQLDREQVHLAQAAAFYAHSPAIHIPQLWPFCTAQMTAMEQIDGCKITDSDVSPSERQRLARTLIEALIAQPFWNDATTSAVFHADPHAGNLFVTRDGRLAILDWALITPLHKAQRIAVVQAVISALSLDESGLTRAIAGLGSSSDETAVRTAAAAALHQVRQGTFPGLDWLMALLDRLGTAGVLRFPEELTLFRKAMLTLSGVLDEVSERPSIDAVLLATGLTQFGREWPTRGFAPFDSRAFGTHLSNADGLSLWTGLPLTATRYWLGLWQDALDIGNAMRARLSKG